MGEMRRLGPPLRHVQFLPNPALANNHEIRLVRSNATGERPIQTQEESPKRKV